MFTKATNIKIFTGALIALMVAAIAVPEEASAARSVNKSTHAASRARVNSTFKPYTNIYEQRIISLRRQQAKYQVKLARWEMKIARKKAKAAEKREKRMAKIRAKRLKMMLAHQRQMAKLQQSKGKAQPRVRQATARGRLSRPRPAQQGNGAVVNTRQAPEVRSSVPKNPTLLQRLRYAFTGRYE